MQAFGMAKVKREGTHELYDPAQRPDRRFFRKAGRKPGTRMHFGTELHTQWFDGTDKPGKVGRYKVKYAGAERFVFRWWNGSGWQFNRRKAGAECQQPGRSDKWCGLAENKGLH